jgi:FixJ family two-component response regulator
MTESALLPESGGALYSRHSQAKPWGKAARSAPTILVVDDDGSVRKALGRLFKSAGYAVELYASAEEYLTRPSAPPPACLVIDMKMAGMGGLELQRAIGGTARSLPIVFITGDVDDDSRAQALARGAVAVVSKPLDELVLFGAIRIALGPPSP